MKKVLVTGGAGFIGSEIALKLIEKGYNVRILDNLSPQIHGVNAKLPQKLDGMVEFILGDIRNINDLMKALDGQDAVIHLAAETGTGQSMYELHKYCDVNINGTANLLDVLTNSKHSIQKFIISSSRAIYGEGKYYCKKDGVVFPNERKKEDMLKGDFEVKCPICGMNVELCATSEDSYVHPTSIYGLTKQMQEKMVMAACNAIDIPWVSYRYQNVYGSGQSLSNPYTGILSIFSNRILNDKEINIFEDGLETRDFIYISDVVEATILGLENQKANFNVFNVGAGISTSVKDIVEILGSVYDKYVKMKVTGDFRIGDIRHNYADIRKIKDVLGFEPKVSLDKGIKKFSKWVLQQKMNDNGYEKSIEEMKQKGLMY